MRPFELNVMKTIQAIGVLLHTLQLRRLEYLSILKMLYFVDRESVRDRGRPVTGDTAVAMKNGPVLSGVYDLIHFNTTDSLPLWTTYLSKDDYDLVLNKDPDIYQLSRYEIRKLEEIAKRYENCGWREIVRISHELPEWQKNDPDKFGVRVTRIPLEDIYEAVGRSKDMAVFLEDAEAATACRQQLK